MTSEITMRLDHGEGIISVNDNVITVKIQGVYNQEGVVELRKKLSPIIENFHADGFKILANYLEAEGGTPDAYNEVNRFNIWLNEKNLIAKAVVINSAVISSILDSRTPARQLQNIKSFDNTIAAIQWLESQL